MKVYKSKIYKVIIQLILGILAAAAAALIASIFFADIYVYAAAVVIYILYVKFMVLDSIIELRLYKELLIYKKGRKEKEYYLKDYEIGAVVSDGDGKLILKSEKGTESIDCSMLGVFQFDALLCELGVIGESAKSIKVETKKKE